MKYCGQFSNIEPCFTHQQLIKKIRNKERITMNNICPWHPGNSCKCGYGTNEKGFRFGEKYLCKSDFLTGKCTCISDFIESEPIEQHKTVHQLLSELKFKIDNLKQGEIKISKEDKKLIEKEEIDIDDFDEVTTFLLKHYQKKWELTSDELLKNTSIFGLHPTKLYNMKPLFKQWADDQKTKVKNDSYCEELALLKVEEKSTTEEKAQQKSSTEEKTNHNEDSDSDSELDEDFFD